MKHHPTLAEIDLNAFSHNLQQVRLRVGKERKIIAVAKADAYGHGAVEIARRACTGGADMLGVGNVEEGIELREAGITAPILILGGYLKDNEAKTISYNLKSVIYSYQTALNLSMEAEKKGKEASVHIKIDTGMGRIGIQPDKAKEFIGSISSLKNIRIEGMLTHFASAYERDRSFTEKQINIFKQLIDELRQNGYSFPLIHASNSAAILNYPDSYFNAVRPGIILYGSLPFEFPLPPLSPPYEGGEKEEVFKPVMSWKTEIIHINIVPEKTGISYGRRFITERKSIIAAIPVGYADGLSRSLSNNVHVLVRGRGVSQVGTIC
ncbi:MAG: alanine racemase, partial [Nitrospinae bacterium]|nr:alanine racemase [Nitrospinota bacterium]